MRSRKLQCGLPTAGAGWWRCAVTLVLLFRVAGSPAAEIAVVGESNFTQSLCALLAGAGHGCITLPITDPMPSFNSYDIIVTTGGWSDPDKALPDHLRAGRGVITWGDAPRDIGIDSDQLVQAWIGAQSFTWGGNALLTALQDPILGDLPVGTMLENCFDATDCTSLAGVSGHPGAKLLAYYGWIENGNAGILRNEWQAGRSVYFTSYVGLTNPIHQQIILAAVDELTPPYPSTIPAASTWGLVALALLLASGASVLLRRRCGTRSVGLVHPNVAYGNVEECKLTNGE